MDIRLRNLDEFERLSGAIICDKEIYPIKFGIPILIPQSYRKKYGRLRVAYEALGYAPWRATKSDWIKHMRAAHLWGIYEAVKLLEDRTRINILSIGCGWGWEIWALMRLLKDSAFYLGVDLSRKPLILANKIKKRVNSRNAMFAVALTEHIPLKSNSFDLITAIFGPLDHTHRYERAFMEIGRLLRPGGVFLFTVLNRFSLDWILKVVKNLKLYTRTLKKAGEKFVRITLPTPKERAYRITTHFYDVFELKKLLKWSGMKLIKSRSIFSILPANFRSEKFSMKDKILSQIELCIGDKPVIRLLGRYIEGIAIKID
ncbi:MAG: methyltransferase domain-containing protein [Candidatus Njordarchaeia archaeon]